MYKGKNLMYGTGDLTMPFETQEEVPASLLYRCINLMYGAHKSDVH